MVTAYILVKTHTGDADRIREAIADIDGVDTTQTYVSMD